MFYEHYKENSPSLSLAENCCDHSEDIIQYLVNIDEDLGNWHPEDLLEEIFEFHSQVNCHDNQGKLVENKSHQEIEIDPKDLSVETNDNSSTFLCEAKKDIHPHDQYSQDKEKNWCSIQRKQRFPPPLTEE